jgi:hypothetical protein
MPKKKKLCVFYDRKTTFPIDQYWNVHYTEIFKDKTEKDYKTIIKSRSANFAKEILLKKVKEDNPGHRIKSFSCFLLSKKSTINNLKLDLKDWGHIRACSFPNVANILFKHLYERPKHYTNRFNKIKNYQKLNVFKSGQVPKPKPLTDLEKSHMIYKGKWIPWPKKEREAFKEKIILSLSLNNNNRKEAAKHMGVSSRYFRKILTKRFPEIDWAKSYPPPPPTYNPQTAKTNKKLWAKKRNAKYKSLLPKIKDLQNSGFNQIKISKILKISKLTIRNCLKYEQK